MIVTSYFSGDENEKLKDIQFDLYSELCGRLVDNARDQYLRACRLLQIEDELSIQLRRYQPGDHRVFQDVHDLIAAWFRFSRDDHGQFRLGENEESYWVRVSEEWQAFFMSELECYEYGQFTRNIVIARVFENTEPGYAAEKFLMDTLKLRYREMTKFDQDQDEDSA